MTDPRNPAIAAAERLQESVVDLKEEIRGLRSYGERNRHLIVGLAVSLVLDVLLTIGVIIAAVTANHAGDLAAANRQNQLDTCTSTNQTRQASRNLWNYVLDQAAKDAEGQTPERRRQIAEFRTYMQSAYADRDCSKIGR
ncbi:hypothetical protein [Amycolatopsis dendrobii]|uniref:Uncharacterized protein n=1 Tax=Amycolatopsis dendrobii TaxID=2760662 RepID=A0A7W3VVF6_9PSEU|nr:hypothetical protein [Amycolatopsis dendrobii]MBB1153532.1 hypothetical protein [Amycolatopsis dendrobii]